VKNFDPVLVVLVAQLLATSYGPWRYGAAVIMVSGFGTMATDVLHIQFCVHCVPSVASTIGLAITLGGIFAVWHRSARSRTPNIEPTPEPAR
jgi:uncharacterized membrane-anchored protein